jgi:MSHA pilin protein MshD
MPTSFRPRCNGFSLVELLIFIVVVTSALAGVVSVFVNAGAKSADPLLQRQALAIAESLLEEVTLMPFTFCDGNDANVATATGTGDCAGGADQFGPGGRSRTALPPFDSVLSYHGYAMNGIVDITGGAVPGLAGYSASVSVAGAALGSIPAASGDAVLITVTVTDPRGGTLSLTGYRTRHAPNVSL